MLNLNLMNLDNTLTYHSTMLPCDLKNTSKRADFSKSLIACLQRTLFRMNIPRLRFSTAIGLAAILFCSITAEAQTSSAAEWSTRIWSSASDGNWEAVDVLLSDVPEGDDVNLVAFRNQLEAYRNQHNGNISSVYLENMLSGLENWIKAGNSGDLNWGILHFKKR